MDEKTPPRQRTPLAPLQCSLIQDRVSPNKTTAYHLTPFEARDIRKKRAKELGLTSSPSDPYLHNQSFPSLHYDPENGNSGLEMGDIRKCTIDKFKGDALDSVSYSPKSSHENELHNNRHLNASWFCKHVEETSGNPSLHAYVQNPNKAIVTIDARTTEILTANKLSYHLLGIRNGEGSAKLKDYLLSPEDQYLFSDADLKSNGELVLFSGKVMDLITSSDIIVPVSVWARKLCSDGDFRCLVVMEPVERITGTVKFDAAGTVINCDRSFCSLYGYPDPEDIVGKNMKELIPSIVYSERGVKQCVTGRTIDGFIFPLSIRITPCSKENVKIDKDRKEDLDTAFYEGVVWVFNNISGLITLLPDGTIHSCNTNFSLMLFGYSQNELVGKNISTLIPSFHDDVEFLDTDSMALPPFDDDDDSNAKYGTSDGRTTAESMGNDLPRPINPLGRPMELRDEDMQSTAFTEQSSPSVLSDKLENSPDVEQLENNPLETATVEGLKLEELSASSSQYGSSSKHLSYSESQDTLHSCTNSITESDINANFFAAQLENKEGPEGDSHSRKDSICIDEKEHCDSDVFETESSDNEESEQSDFEDCESSDNGKGDSPCAEEDIYFTEKPPLSNYISATFSPVTASEKNSNASRNCHVSPTECGLSCQARSTNISTPKDNLKPLSDISFQSIPEGDFIGIGRHKDGTDLAIDYYIKKVTLDDGKCLYCLWVSRDPDEIKECSPVSKMRYSNSHSESSRTSQSKSEKTTTATDSSNSSLLADSDYIAGSFSENYTILQHIRKGAFGCIKKAYRKSDGLLVIAKFIRKSEVYEDSWVHDNKLNQKVPLEISLLTTLDHPNIVRVLDVFQNDLCFQMVMEKHGCGMDLFEFIERDPKMDEPLSCYIFRQIVSALSYLHGLSILHRDIKDENVIINEKFHIKLIDFGSATFMGDELFSTFCGTMEYCSPEVIRGNKYRGPELEMFSLGVTLYTLIFGENPFVGADEILKGEYDIPSRISDDLSNLISHLLEPDPVKRCTLPEVEEHPWIIQVVPIGRYDFSEVVRASADEVCPAKYHNLLPLDLDFDSSNSTGSEVSYLGKKLEDIELSGQPCSSSESEINSLS